MTTKTAKGKITGLLALSMEATEAAEIGDPVQGAGDYEVEIADGSKPVIGFVSVANKGRVSTPLSTSVGNPIVPGPVTVEARGLMVRTIEAGGAIAAGEEVGINSAGDLVPAGVSIATVGISLMAAAGTGDLVDVLVR